MPREDWLGKARRTYACGSRVRATSEVGQEDSFYPGDKTRHGLETLPVVIMAVMLTEKPEVKAWSQWTRRSGSDGSAESARTRTRIAARQTSRLSARQQHSSAITVRSGGVRLATAGAV